MHKKIVPTMRPLDHIAQFPHCDAKVLHAPGECTYCDHHPDWQALRVAWGIAFTGYEPDGQELPDPATVARPVKTIHQWGGNRPAQG